MKHEKILLFGILILFSLTLLSAFNIGDNVDIKVSCLNIDCATTTEISIEYPNTTLVIDNETMTTKDGFVNYTFSNTDVFGEYKYYLVNVGGTPEFYEGSFIVGQELTTGRSIGYIGFTLILLFTFLLTMYGASKIEWKHRRSDEGKILTINNFRYIKVLLYAIAYFEIMFLFGLSYKLSNEANIDGFTEFFNFIYQLLLNLIFPLMIFLIIVIFVIWINNKKLHKKLKLGL